MPELKAEVEAYLGQLHELGERTKKDQQKALYWYEKSAAQGNPDAQAQLGRAYAHGAGVPEDLIEAYKWFLLADKNGHKDARNILTQISPSMTPGQIEDAKRRAGLDR